MPIDRPVLPIDCRLEEIAALIARSSRVILTAAPGTGKTTRIPPALLSVIPGKIAVLQPRRLAAVAACERVAQEQGWRVGQEVGYQVRFESKITSATRLVYMTDALMLRRWVEDLELSQFSLIIIDELHERNLQQDLLLGAIKELQELGAPIKLLLMSATLESQELLNFLPGGEWIDVAGVSYPLTVRHSTTPLSLQTDFAFIERIVGAVTTACAETRGDVLVFLPGVGEIRRVQEKLESNRLTRPVYPLHGTLSLAEQAQVLAPSEKPRVILSTNVAEASVTVQGVDFVIDSGIARVSNVNLTSGFSTLELKRISLFNARQRSGRAAREKAGTCWRLWTSHEEATQIEQQVPECMRTDLSAALLLLAHSGLNDFAAFAWLSRPPGRLLDLAIQYLRSLGALGGDNRLTPFGQRLLRFPLPPRLAAMLCLGYDPELAARVAAILNERDFLTATSTTLDQCDVTLRLQTLVEVERRERVPGVKVQLAHSILQTAEQLRRLGGATADTPPAHARSLKRMLLLTHADRLCRRRGESARGLMVGGRGVKLSAETTVTEREFFIALQGVDLPGQNETTVNLACGLNKSEVCEMLADHIQVSEKIEFIESKAAFYCSRVRSVFGLAIDEPTLTPAPPEQVREQLAELLLQKWMWLVDKNLALKSWMARWEQMCQVSPDLTAHFGEVQIAQTLQMAAFGKTKVSEVVDSDLMQFLRLNVPPEVLSVVDREAPTHFVAPTGHAHVIQYTSHGPFVEVRLQELFGLDASPKLLFGSVPLRFHLLAPNFRPVQVTSDLAGFWTGAYVDVRKELRTRYPKHSWPENPATAKPEAKGRRRV